MHTTVTLLAFAGFVHVPDVAKVCTFACTARLPVTLPRPSFVSNRTMSDVALIEVAGGFGPEARRVTSDGH